MAKGVSAGLDTVLNLYDSKEVLNYNKPIKILIKIDNTRTNFLENL
jgi:hypothetical protein